VWGGSVLPGNAERAACRIELLMRGAALWDVADWGSWRSDDGEWPHHFIVFVVKDVAVPYIISFDVEECLDDGDITWIADDGVLASGFVGFGWQHGDGRSGGIVHGGHISHGAAGDASNDLKSDEVQVYGVSIHGEVMDFPGFAGTQFGSFCGWMHPAHGHGHIHLHGLIELHGPEQPHDWSVEGRAEGGGQFVERDFASDHRCREFGHGRELNFGDWCPCAASGSRNGWCGLSFDSFGGRIPGDAEFHYLTRGCRVGADHPCHPSERGVRAEVEELYFGADGQG